VYSTRVFQLTVSTASPVTVTSMLFPFTFSSAFQSFTVSTVTGEMIREISALPVPLRIVATRLYAALSPVEGAKPPQVTVTYHSVFSGISADTTTVGVSSVVVVAISSRRRSAVVSSELIVCPESLGHSVGSCTPQA